MFVVFQQNLFKLVFEYEIKDFFFLLGVVNKHLFFLRI